ncbi:dolichyl-phosphate beta-glucosyltransferase [Malassezia psittaci]|uniref:dolichyl-phosphate beta-glucosyltransferase n=1 Tax=Malassezia psittaci TaxID=1821823 RepID=A0AAF0JCD3_9BASI|nr:dolichyl-phosphate beta-glucosyltransferase [Malassezia psittaci]
MYTSPRHTKPVPLPTLQDADEVQLSVVVPMYNEKDRLPAMLDDALTWLESVRKQNRSLCGELALDVGHRTKNALTSPLKTYEIILVDDGSNDATYQVAMDYAEQKRLDSSAEIRITQLHTNRGKGAAVRHGVLHARGAFILFADADGATRFSDLQKLSREMCRILTDKGHGIVVGSRAHLVRSDAVVKRSFLRNLLMRGFHLTLSVLMRPPNVRALGDKLMNRLVPKSLHSAPKAKVEPLAIQPEIHDTQCGFKLFSRESARVIFPLAHIDRWIFDVELLLLAEMASRKSEADHTLHKHHPQASSPAKSNNLHGSQTKSESSQKAASDPLLHLALPISEVAVQWTEIDGSKISLLRDSIRMGRDLIIIRLNYALARWASPNSLYA